MTKKLALLVDDDLDFLQSTSARCSALGLEVKTASNSFTALSRLEEETPDVVFMDIEMPTGNGLSIREYLLSEPHNKIPVVMVSGKNDPETLHQCRQMNSVHVSKSTRMWEQLTPIIEEIVGENA